MMSPPWPIRGIILYGAPATGKSTIAVEIVRALSGSHYHYRVRRHGASAPEGGTYRESTGTPAEADVVYEYEKYGNLYTIDREGFDANESMVPVIEAGEHVAVARLRDLSTSWLVLQLWSPRSICAERLQRRSASVASERLRAWDNTIPIVANAVINTSLDSPAEQVLSRVDQEQHQLLTSWYPEWDPTTLDNRKLRVTPRPTGTPVADGD